MPTHRPILIVIALLLAPAGFTTGAVPPAGCFLPFAGSSCTFDCPVDSILAVALYGGKDGARVFVTCSSNTIDCMAGPLDACADTGATLGGGTANCTMQDFGPDPDSMAWCGVLSVIVPHPDPPTCDPQPVHTYHTVRTPERAVLFVPVPGRGLVTVEDSNMADCNDDRALEDFDGDYDRGLNGGFFGHGVWANEPTCRYELNTHGGNVLVNDVIFGSSLEFVMGEDDRNGPVVVNGVCSTSGVISPDTDPDDCISQIYVGTGTTCGTGGGDGGFWVLLLDPRAEVAAEVKFNNPAIAGTITAF